MSEAQAPGDLQEMQMEVDREILDALVQATPEWWHAATLDLDFDTSGSTTRIGHVVRNPDGDSAEVELTEELSLATRKLDLLLKRFSMKLKRARYEIREKSPGRWVMRSDFKYE